MSQTNYVKKIIISGAGGTLGTHIAEHLIAQGKHDVSALTRPTSTSTFPFGLAAIKRVDQNNHEALVAALQGEEVLILTLAPATPLDTQKPLIRAAAEAGVKYIMPNEYGTDMSHDSLVQDSRIGVQAREIRAYIESVGAGKTHWIALSSSFWYEFSLAGYEMRFGFDFEKKAVTLIDGGNTKICTTTGAQSARAIARLFALPVRGMAGYKGPTLGQWEDGAVYVSSFTVSQREMLASVLRVTGERESDWTIRYEDSKERFQRGVKQVEGGDAMGAALMVYTRVFYPNGGGDYSHKVVNDLLDLPKEDLDAATKEGIRIQKGSFWEDRLAGIASRATKA